MQLQYIRGIERLTSTTFSIVCMTSSLLHARFKADCRLLAPLVLPNWRDGYIILMKAAQIVVGRLVNIWIVLFGSGH
jgi:hypothetical protein